MVVVGFFVLFCLGKNLLVFFVCLFFSPFLVIIATGVERNFNVVPFICMDKDFVKSSGLQPQLSFLVFYFFHFFFLP